MSGEVVITLFDAVRGESRYVFHEPERIMIGRGDDCEIQVPSDDQHRDISRHHCVLEIDPPRVFISDLDSTNGTFVNGDRIGLRHRASKRNRKEEESGQMPPTVLIELRDGYEVHLGRLSLSFVVDIHAHELAIA
jgi:pSer/pThr/pTyr-binding forkhead associated (FHA) protein